MGMLVLSRKRGERLLIGTDVVVEVIDIRGDKVRLGIAAPKSVLVDREEVACLKKPPKPTTPLA